MTHVFMDMLVKEAAKEAFGFTAVPFYVIVDKVVLAEALYYIKLLQYLNSLLISFATSIPSITLVPSYFGFNYQLVFTSMQVGRIIGSGQPPALDYKKLIREAIAINVVPKADSVTESEPVKNTFTLDEDF